MEIFVSIIIPTFNRPSTLSFAINSIIKASVHTNKNIEIIIVNDGGCKLTLNLELFSSTNIHIVLLENDTNQGLSASRNMGLAVAKGEFVAFLDDDDFYNEMIFSELETVAKDTNYNVFYFNTLVISERETRKIESSFSYSFSKEMLMVTNYIPIISGFLRREVLKDISFYNYSTSEDWDFWLQVISKINSSFKHIESDQVYYFRNENWPSMTTTENQLTAANNFYNNYRTLIKKWPTNDKKVIFLREKVLKYYIERIQRIEKGDKIDLFSYELLLGDLFHQFNENEE